MPTKSAIIPPSLSTESLGDGWKIPTRAVVARSPSDGSNGSALSSPRLADSNYGSAPPASPSSSASSPAARRPTPVPRAMHALLRLVYSARQIESLFYDDIITEDEVEQEVEREQQEARRSSGAGATTTPPPPTDEQPRRRPQQLVVGSEEEVEEEQEQEAAANAANAAQAAEAATQARAQVSAVREALAAAADDARARHPFLLSAANQDAVGLAVLSLSALSLIALFAAYARGLAPWFLVVPCAAFLTSLLHELEHDLIHSLYFRGRRLALPAPLSPPSSGQRGGGVSAIDAALAVCYAFRPSTINPFARRALHLNHHRVSGAAGDLEERSITNGLSWSPLRLVATGDNLLAIGLRPQQTLRELRSYMRAQPAAVRADPQERLRVIVDNASGYAPLGFVHYALLWSFCVVGALSLVLGKEPAALLAAALGGGASSTTQQLWSFLRFFAVTFGAPQYLRTFCLHFVSSNVHYYSGGARAVSLPDQTQIVDAPLFWPLQLFCFNFGATHALHHFAPAQPFYLRQAVSGDARVRAALRAAGVRFNDLGTFGRANRLPLKAA